MIKNYQLCKTIFEAFQGLGFLFFTTIGTPKTFLTLVCISNLNYFHQIFYL